ncbi:hypothetical protein E4T56_gene4807 [Termitomyces sp. T112]|nr:hypothetical protein E4T56_gene4807 [Termitomyces sp. T112]
MVSPPRQVVVDDTDSQIGYFGSGWFSDRGSQDTVGNFGPTYNKTSHGTKGNDSASFSFVGSSVTVWGTTSLKTVDNGTGFDPHWECFVDQISIGATKPFQFAENNWQLCEQASMTDGPHVLTINVTSAGNTFWFDYLTYTPSPSASYETTVLLVQNTDSAITYDSGWGELGNTANMTTKVGSEVKFDFVGTSLAWVGFIPTELPHNASVASYSIDHSAPIDFNLEGLASTATTTIYNQVFITADDLTAGPHTILVTYKGSDNPSTPLTLDYLFVTNTSLPVKISGGSLTFPASSTISSSASFVPTVSPTAHQNTPVGPVVGGVVGGLAAIAILFFALWRWCQIRAIHIESGTGFLGTGNSPSHARIRQSQMTPYTHTPFMQSLEAGPLPVNHMHSSSCASRSLPDSSTRTSDINGYAAGATDQIHAIRKSRDPVGPTIPPVVHQDSGIRLHPPELDAIIEDIPPMYTAA